MHEHFCRLSLCNGSTEDSRMVDTIYLQQESMYLNLNSAHTQIFVAAQRQCAFS